MEHSIKILLGTSSLPQKGAIQAGPSKAALIPGTKTKGLGIEFQKNFALVLLGNVQNGMESLSSLKSVQLTWDSTFSIP